LVFLQEFAEGAEFPLPEPFILPDPVRDRFQFYWADSIQTLATRMPVRDQPRTAKDAQVLGHRRLRHSKSPDEVIDRPFTF
jgi:hypothetical protein